MQQNIKEHRYTTVEAFRNDIKQVSISFCFFWFKVETIVF